MDFKLTVILANHILCSSGRDSSRAFRIIHWMSLLRPAKNSKLTVSEQEGKRQQYENKRFEPQEVFGVKLCKEDCVAGRTKSGFKDCPFKEKLHLSGKVDVSKSEQRYSANG